MNERRRHLNAFNCPSSRLGGGFVTQCLPNRLRSDQL
jgi:hypothetical protein